MEKKCLHAINIIILFFLCHLSAISKSHFGFIKNNGQIIDQNNQPNTAVKYLYNSNGLNVQLKNEGFSYELHKSSKVLKDFSNLTAISKKPRDSFDFSIESHRIDIVFEGASADLEIVPLLVKNSMVNFYTTGIGINGIQDVNHFNKVLYRNVYPNIDVEFVLSDNNTKSGFKYNFILHPGASINDIKLKILGANGSAINKEGHISIVSALGIIEEKIPYSFQITNGKESAIQAHFKETGNNLFGIEALNYNTASTLVIDPTPWATYFGGAMQDLAYDVTTDSLNNIYTTGITYSSNNIATSGAYQNTYVAGSDIFISKHSENGQLLWATYYGGSGNDFSYSIVIDDSLNVYIGGSTRSPSIQAGADANSKAIVARFNTNGTKFWTSYFSVSYDEEILDIAVGTNNYLYFVGYTLKKGYWTSGSTYIAEKACAYGRVKKFFGHNFQFSSISPASNAAINAELNTITLDSSNNVYMSGSSEKIDYSFNSYPSINSPNTGFLLKTTADFGKTWVRYFNRMPKNVTKVFQNDLVLVESKGGNSYLTHLNSNGNLIRSIDINNTTITQIRPSGTKHFILSGYTSSNYSLSTPNAFQKNHTNAFEYLNTNNDAVLIKYDSSGNKIWGTYYGASGNDYANSLAISKSNQIILIGNTNSTTKISTPMAANTVFSGGEDAFITLFNDSGYLNGINNNIITSYNKLCSTTDTVTLTGSTPGGVSGSVNYLWLKSTLGADTGYAAAPGINNTKDYKLTNNTATWYKRVVINSTNKDTSLFKRIDFMQHPGGGFLLSKNTICQASSTLFTDTSTFTRSKIEMLALPATGNYNGSLTFQDTGMFSIKLINHNNGCIDTISKNVIVQSKPFVGFTINKDIQTLNNNAFQLNDTSTFAGTSSFRLWNFSKNTTDTSNLKMPVKTYNALGYNFIKLKVVGNNLCSDSLTKQVAICKSIENNINSTTLNCNSSTILASPATGGFQAFYEDFSDSNALPNGWSSAFMAQANHESLIYGSPQGPWAPNFNLINSYGRIGPKGALITTSYFNSYLESPIFTKTKNGATVKFDIYDNVADHKYNVVPMRFDSLTLWAKCNGTYQVVRKFGGTEILSRILGQYSASYTPPDTINWKTFETVLPTGTTQIKFTFLVGSNYFGNNRIYLDRIMLDTNAYKTITWLRSPSLNGVYSPATGIVSNSNFISNTPGANYYKRVYNTGEISDTTEAVLINIYPRPTALFTVGDSLQCLNGNKFNFTNHSTIAAGGSITKYLWKLGNGDTSSSTSIINKTYKAAGNYTVKLIASTNNNCTDSITKNIKVYPNPNIGYISTKQLGSTTKITFVDTTSHVKNRLWTFDKLITDTAKTSIQKVLSGSSIMVKLLVMSKDGCSDSISNMIRTLPVTWLKIAAKRVLETEAAITWSTGSEINNSHFEIESSSDFKNWKTIGKVTGNGNSNMVRDYQFIDKEAIHPIIHYRIKQVDFDGNYEYSNIVNISSEIALSTNIKVYPNPFANTITIEQLEDDYSNTAYLYDNTGKLIQQFHLYSYMENLIISDLLSPGIYHLKVNGTTSKITKIENKQ